MFHNYVYSQHPSYLMELKCNFYFMPICTCGILTVTTSESARVSNFSPHVIFAGRSHRICNLTVAMIDKTSSGFNLCHHKNSLPSTLILYGPIEMKTY